MIPNRSKLRPSQQLRRQRLGARRSRSRARSFQRLNVEALENRLLLTVTWDGGAGTFNWNDAGNWDTDSLPGAADAVVIPDLAGTPTIIHPSGAHTVASLATSESFALSG